LCAWGAGLGVLGIYLLPDLSTSRLVAGAIGGLVAAFVFAWALDRWPYLLAFATLACIPLRIPVDIGSDTVNLLLPLYAVIGGLALAIAWSLVKGDTRSRELGPVAVPLAAFVGWTGLSMLWTGDVRRGAIFLAAFVLPFGLVAIGFARLPWRGRWLTWLWGGLVATALLYALVGGYQWFTRDVFWNPSVKVFNAYAPFFRVNSVFWDPSVYGRYLTVAVLASLAGILLGGVRGWRVAGLYAVVVATWLGLLISFSQSSFVALSAGIVAAASVVWGRRALVALIALGLVTCVVLFAVPQLRDDLVGKSRSGVNRVTSGRANLVGQAVNGECTRDRLRRGNRVARASRLIEPPLHDARRRRISSRSRRSPSPSRLTKRRPEPPDGTWYDTRPAIARGAAAPGGMTSSVISVSIGSGSCVVSRAPPTPISLIAESMKFELLASR